MSTLDYTNELIQKYLDDMKMLDKTPATLRTYGNQLGWYTAWLEAAGKTLAEVGPRDVEAFANRRRRGGPPAVDSIRQAVTVVRGFHRWCIDIEGLGIDNLKRARIPKRRDRTPKPIDDATWLRIWTADLHPQDRLWLGLGFYCGLRREEIVVMPPNAVNPESGYLWFKRKGGSTDPVEYLAMLRPLRLRLPHLTVQTEEWMRILHETALRRSEQHLPTLYWDVNVDGEHHRDAERLNKRLYGVLEGLGEDRQLFSPHMLRHSCATNLHRSGVDVATIANLLSHSSPAITMGYIKTAGTLDTWCDEQEMKAQWAPN